MKKTILYIGGVRKGGNGPDWIKAIRNLGFNVVYFDLKNYQNRGSRLEKYFARKVCYGRYILILNRDLKLFCDNNTYDFAIVNKGMYLSPSTVKYISYNSTDKKVIHLAVDSMFTDNRSRLFIKSIPYYTTLWTDKKFEEDSYYRAGAKKVVIYKQPFGLRFESQKSILAALPEVPDSDVCFIGHCQNHYITMLKAISDMNVDLKIWGPGWLKAAQSKPWLKKHVKGEGLWGSHYPAAVRRSKIGIGLLSKRIPEEATTRSVEIPAGGSLLLAERSAQHLQMFQEGIEAEFFSNSNEMCDKIKYYLSNESERSNIASNGFFKVHKVFNMHLTLKFLLDASNIK